MLTRISTLSLLVVLFFHSSVLAHGGKPHVMGTVTALDAQHVVVETKEGKTISIVLNTETKYRKGQTAATGADLKVGDRVVVHTAGKGDTLTASEIHFSSADGKKGHKGMTHGAMTP
jgi:ribosomal protein S1